MPPQKKSRNCYGEIDKSKNSDELNKITDTLNKRLCRAAHNGKLDIVKYLIRSGANVNANIEGKTALLLAVQNGHTNIVGYLK